MDGLPREMGMQMQMATAERGERTYRRMASIGASMGGEGEEVVDLIADAGEASEDGVEGNELAVYLPISFPLYK